MKNISQLKAMALEQLKGKWTNSAIATLVFFAITLLVGGVGKYSSLFIFHVRTFDILTFLIAGPLQFGFYKYFLNVKRNEPVTLETLFDGFKRFIASFLLILLMTIFIILWSLLLIVPGFIAALSYSQAIFILIDNPEMTAMDAIKKSKELMRGHRWEFFVTLLSFIGWALLVVLTIGIGYFWLAPYISVTLANFYDELKELRPVASAK